MIYKANIWPALEYLANCLSNFWNTTAECLQKLVFWRHLLKPAYITPFSYRIHRLNTSSFCVKNVQILSESVLCGVLLFSFSWRLLTAPFQSFDKQSHSCSDWLTHSSCVSIYFSYCFFFKHKAILRCCVSKVIPRHIVNNSGFCISKNLNQKLTIMATKITQNQYVIQKENSLSQISTMHCCQRSCMEISSIFRHIWYSISE